MSEANPTQATEAPTIDAIRASAEDVAVLRHLPEIAAHAGYLDVYLLYGALHLRRDALRKEQTSAPPALRALLQLFALGEAVEPASLTPILDEAAQAALLRLGVLLKHEGLYKTGGLTLMPVLGRMAFVPTPPHNPMAYFGDDVVGLLSRIAPPRNAHALNLYAGAGLATLIAAERCKHVITVESNQLARACAELNVVMNGLTERVEVLDDAAFAARPREARYDYVLANGPLLPFPQRLFTASGGAQNEDGALSPTALLLQSLPQLLKHKGQAQLVGADLGDSSGPALAAALDRVAKEHGLSVMMTVPCHCELPPESRVMQALAWACHSVSGQPLDNARDRLLAHLQESGFNTLYLFYVTASFSTAHAGLHVSRFDQWGKGFWFR